ncbi:MAG: ABC transporter ATP-binding protein [Candidatus Hodarchaeota archaeon]
MVKVDIDQLSKAFGNQIALKDVSFQVTHGNLTIILGPSGCGKTTLLKLIAGILEPDNGTIYFDDKLVNHIPAKERNVGYVPQNLALFPHLTVEKNIQFGLEARHWSMSQKKERLKFLIELGSLYGLETRYPHQISGGQQQRVALLRALAPNPSVLLLDEPLSSLDTQLREKVKWNLRLIQQETETTTIMVTHDQMDARAISDYIVFINEGLVIQKGQPTDILQKMKGYAVASIMGVPNLLKLNNITQTKEGTNLSTDIGLIHMDKIQFPEEEENDLGITIDPQQIELEIYDPKRQRGDTGGYNQFEAKVLSIEEHDNGKLINVEIQGTIISVVSSAREIIERLKIGDLIVIFLQPGSLRLIGL